MGWFEADRVKYAGLASGWIVPQAGRCVQCGICSFNCPMGIDVRRHAWRGEPVEQRCLTCGECARRCPRGLLRLEPIAAVPRIRRSPAARASARHHVLIGSGPAAIAAAEAIREADGSARVTMVSADPHGYYSRPGLAYVLDREVPERRLFPFGSAELTGVDTYIRGRVLAVDPAAHELTLEDGRRLSYDRLLLATGSRAVPLGVSGAELDGVLKLDDMEDARGLIARCRRAKTAVVVGGGITALEVVEGLRARDVHVHYLLRRDRFWANVLSASESRLIEGGLREEGVEIHRHTEIGRVLGDRRARVAGVETADGGRVDCQIVAVAVGVRPQVELARGAGLACGRGVLVDEYLRSSDEHVFAAGDIAETAASDTGHRTLHVLWNTAVAKGRAAGRNMVAGPVSIWKQGTPLNITRLAGLPVTIIGTVGAGEDADLKGLSRGDSQVWSELQRATVVEGERDGAHARLALRGGVIVGAVLIGEQGLSSTLQRLIEGRVDTGGLGASAGGAEAWLAALLSGARERAAAGSA